MILLLNYYKFMYHYHNTFKFYNNIEAILSIHWQNKAFVWLVMQNTLYSAYTLNTRVAPWQIYCKRHAMCYRTIAKLFKILCKCAKWKWFIKYVTNTLLYKLLKFICQERWRIYIVNMGTLVVRVMSNIHMQHATENNSSSTIGYNKS